MSALPSLVVLAIDLVLVLASIALAERGGIVFAACAVGCALLALVHMYLLHHECAHRSVFADDRYNVLLGHALGLALLLPFHPRRRNHALHHAFAGHAERDPTNARARRRLVGSSPRTRRVLDLLWRSWVPFLAFNERVGLWRESFSRTTRGDVARRERRAALGSLFAYLAISAALWHAQLLATSARLYATAFVLLLLVEELINLPHHAEAPLVTVKLHLSQQGSVTHSCAGVPIWSRCVLLNFNLHTLHHASPSTPWYRLPELAQASAATTRDTCNELAWSWQRRRRPFEEVFAAYFREQV